MTPAKPIPVAIRRLMDEVRHENNTTPTAYDRAHNRHNRGGYNRFLTPDPVPELIPDAAPKPEVDPAADS